MLKFLVLATALAACDRNRATVKPSPEQAPLPSATVSDDLTLYEAANVPGCAARMLEVDAAAIYVGCANTNTIVRVEFGGGQPRVVARSNAVWPVFTIGGGRVYFASASGRISAVPAKGGDETLLATGLDALSLAVFGSELLVAVPDRGVFSISRTVLSAPVEIVRTLRPHDLLVAEGKVYFSAVTAKHERHIMAWNGAKAAPTDLGPVSVNGQFAVAGGWLFATKISELGTTRIADPPATSCDQYVADDRFVFAHCDHMLYGRPRTGETWTPWTTLASMELLSVHLALNATRLCALDLVGTVWCVARPRALR